MKHPETIAEQCMRSDDPYGCAVRQQGYKGMPDAYTKRFHFEDNSYLDFKVTYTPAGAGRTLPDAR